MSTEKERIREKEAEDVRLIGPGNMFVFANRTVEHEHIKSLPRVIDCDNAGHKYRWPGSGHWAGKGGGNNIYVDWVYNDYSELKYPIYTMTVMGKPGRKQGGLKVSRSVGHRHFFEALFYLPGGKGYEIQDGTRWEFDGEGILCVPTYSYHTHFITEAYDKGHFAVISRIFEFLGSADFEQLNEEILEKVKEPDGSLPSWLGVRNPELEKIMMERRSYTEWDQGEPKSIYEQYCKLLIEENKNWQTLPRFIKADQVPWEETGFGKIKYLIHPFDKTSCLSTLDAYMQEIPAGGRSGKHRHVFEEVIYVAEGEGYDIHDGKIYEWKENSMVFIPGNVTHQHFNASARNPAKLVGVNTRWHMQAGYGGIEHLEDA